MYVIVKRLRDTDGSGVIVDMEWYRNDPEENRDEQPVLIDQIMLPAQDCASVTDAMLDNALNKRKAEVEAELTEAATPRPSVGVMVGRARLVAGAGRTRAASDIRAERLAEEARRQATKPVADEPTSKERR